MADEDRLQEAEKRIESLGRLTAFSRRIFRQSLGMSPVPWRERLLGRFGGQQQQPPPAPPPMERTVVRDRQGNIVQSETRLAPQTEKLVPQQQQQGLGGAPIRTRIADRVKDFQQQREIQQESARREVDQREQEQEQERLRKKKREEEDEDLRRSNQFSIEY